MAPFWGRRIMNGKTLLNKIKRCEPLTEKEIEYLKKWYKNLLNEHSKEEEKAEKEMYARAELEQMLKKKGL